MARPGTAAARSFWSLDAFPFNVPEGGFEVDEGGAGSTERCLHSLSKIPFTAVGV